MGPWKTTLRYYSILQVSLLSENDGKKLKTTIEDIIFERGSNCITVIPRPYSLNHPKNNCSLHTFMISILRIIKMAPKLTNLLGKFGSMETVWVSGKNNRRFETFMKEVKAEILTGTDKHFACSIACTEGKVIFGYFRFNFFSIISIWKSFRVLYHHY